MIVPFAWRLVHADVVWGEAETIRPLYPLVPHMPMTAEWQYMDGIGQWHEYMSLREWRVFVEGVRRLYDFNDEPGEDQLQITFCNDYVGLGEAFEHTAEERRRHKWELANLHRYPPDNGRTLRHGMLGPRF